MSAEFIGAYRIVGLNLPPSSGIKPPTMRYCRSTDGDATAMIYFVSCQGTHSYVAFDGKIMQYVDQAMSSGDGGCEFCGSGGVLPMWKPYIMAEIEACNSKL